MKKGKMDNIKAIMMGEPKKLTQTEAIMKREKSKKGAKKKC